MTPFFSVIIPLYNKEKYINETIESVLKQTFVNFELIIINDGSTDNSLKIVKKIKDKRIKHFTNKNMGLSYSRNFGVKISKGKFIAFLDADDLWMADFLQIIKKLISINKNAEIFFTSIKTLKARKKPNQKISAFNTKKQLLIKNYKQLPNHILTLSTMVMNKTIFNTIGGFDERVNYAEDEDFYIRCLAKYKFIFYKDVKAFYRLGIKNQLTSPNSNFKKNIPNFDKYLTKENKADLNPYLDFIYYKILILYKAEKNIKMVKFYSKKINPKNLTLVQQIKFYLPLYLFNFLKKCFKVFN